MNGERVNLPFGACTDARNHDCHLSAHYVKKEERGWNGGIVWDCVGCTLFYPCAASWSRAGS